MSTDTKALVAATPATVALVRRELDKSRESQRGGCGIPKAVKVDCAMVERLCRIAEKQADRLAELEAELARLQEDKARLEQVQSDVLANLDAAPDDMDVISAAHFVAGSLSTAEEALEAAQAEVRELRAELARVRELCPEVIAFAHLMQHKLNMNAHKDGEGWGRDSSGKRGWKSCSPQFLMDKLYEEVLELTIAIHEGDSAKSIRQEAADVGNIAMMLADVCGALSQPAEQHDPLAVSDHCPECSEPEPECVCGEQPAEPGLGERDECSRNL